MQKQKLLTPHGQIQQIMWYNNITKDITPNYKNKIKGDYKNG